MPRGGGKNSKGRAILAICHELTMVTIIVASNKLALPATKLRRRLYLPLNKVRCQWKFGHDAR